MHTEVFFESSLTRRSPPKNTDKSLRLDILTYSLFIIILFRIISAQLPEFYLGVMWEIRVRRFMEGTPTY